MPSVCVNMSACAPRPRSFALAGLTLCHASGDNAKDMLTSWQVRGLVLGV
jgi:hypothetical protein